MVIIGAGGLAKEVLQIALEYYNKDEIYFYDNYNLDKHFLYDYYPILHTIDEVLKCFENNSDFIVAVGGPENRLKLSQEFIKIGGNLITLISRNAFIGSYGVNICNGTIVFPNANISNSTIVGKCVLIYYNANLTHDVIIGDYVEISPNVTVLGKAEIGKLSSLGTGSIIFPKISIAESVIVGAGCVVNKSIADIGVTVVGIPHKILSK